MDDLFAPTHLILIAVIALLIFGPRKLPEIGAGLGRAIREFKESFAGITRVPEDIRSSVRAAGEPAAAAEPVPQAGSPAPAVGTQASRAVAAAADGDGSAAAPAAGPNNGKPAGRAVSDHGGDGSAPPAA